MPLTKLAVDALGVVTLSLVILLLLLSLFCIVYTLYFRSHIKRSGFLQLSYFNGPWLVRILFVLFAICWGFGEVVRLSFFRQKGRFLGSLNQEWQRNVCKYYILWNLGFTEPCLFLTMGFLLRASLKWRGSAILNQRKWNIKTASYIFLYCLPIFVLDLIVVFAGPKFQKGKTKLLKLPYTFTSANYKFYESAQPRVPTCAYPVLCTLLHGAFATILIAYLLLLGRRMVVSVINKGLRKRLCILIFVVSSLLPCRVILLGFSALARQNRVLFEALAFGGFLVLFVCVVVGIFLLVYLPVADSLALGKGPEVAAVAAGGGGSRMVADDEEDSFSLITATNLTPLEASTPGRISDASTKQGSVSFRAMIKDEASSTGVYEEEMATLPPGFDHRWLLSSATRAAP